MASPPGASENHRRTFRLQGASPERGSAADLHRLHQPAAVQDAYGACRSAGKVGQFAGNHFLIIEEGIGQLAGLGRKCLWEVAQDIVFEVS